MEIKKDYPFNSETDKIIGISIEKDNFTINGNNCVLDAKTSQGYSTLLVTMSQSVILYSSTDIQTEVVQYFSWEN